MDAALCAPLPAGPAAGVTSCPKTAVTEAAAAAANFQKSGLSAVGTAGFLPEYL